MEKVTWHGEYAGMVALTLGGGSCFVIRFANQVVTGAEEIFETLTNIRNMLAGEHADERLVHVVENLQCCAFAKRGVMIRVSGSFVVGTHFVPTGVSLLHFLSMWGSACCLEEIWGSITGDSISMDHLVHASMGRLTYGADLTICIV